MPAVSGRHRHDLLSRATVGVVCGRGACRGLRYAMDRETHIRRIRLEGRVAGPAAVVCSPHGDSGVHPLCAHCMVAPFASPAASGGRAITFRQFVATRQPVDGDGRAQALGRHDSVVVRVHVGRRGLRWRSSKPQARAHPMIVLAGGPRGGLIGGSPCFGRTIVATSGAATAPRERSGAVPAGAHRAASSPRSGRAFRGSHNRGIEIPVAVSDAGRNGLGCRRTVPHGNMLSKAAPTAVQS